MAAVVLLRRLLAQRTPLRSIVSYSTSGGSNGDVLDLDYKPQNRPLDPRWRELATKQLKGEDPEEKLTWRTAEVGLSAVKCRGSLKSSY